MMNERGYWGKYRGKVEDNLDPLFLGRIRVSVPSLESDAFFWAMPCVPYAGDGVGFYTMPPIGADVWIEFENGDPSYPIWSGCFWSESSQVPVAPNKTPNPQTKIFKTEYVTLILDDTEQNQGFVTLDVVSPAVENPLSIKLTTTGIEILCSDLTTITMTPEFLELKRALSTIYMTEESILISSDKREIEVIKDGDITINSDQGNIVQDGQEVQISSASDMTLDSGANLEIASGANTTVDASANADISAGANLSMAGSAQASVEGGAQMSVSGATTTVEGSAMAEIKGAMVKIN